MSGDDVLPEAEVRRLEVFTGAGRRRQWTAAAAGIGIALMRPLLIGPELAAGTLVVAHPAGLRDGRDYYLCTRDDRDIPLGVRQLIAWLAQAASQTGSRA